MAAKGHRLKFGRGTKLVELICQIVGEVARGVHLTGKVMHLASYRVEKK